MCFRLIRIIPLNGEASIIDDRRSIEIGSSVCIFLYAYSFAGVSANIIATTSNVRLKDPISLGEY